MPNLPQFLIFDSQRIDVRVLLQLILEKGMLLLLHRHRDFLPDLGGSLLYWEVSRVTFGNGSLMNLMQHLIAATAARRGWPRKTGAKMTG